MIKNEEQEREAVRGMGENEKPGAITKKYETIVDMITFETKSLSKLWNQIKQIKRIRKDW